MEADNDEIAALTRQLRDAEQKAKDAEANMMQAAQFGKDLLDRNIELEAQNEAALQDKYESNLKLQVNRMTIIFIINQHFDFRPNLQWKKAC